MLSRYVNIVSCLKDTRNVRSLIVAVRNHSTVAAADVQLSEWEMAKPFENIPGPKSLPIIGNTWRFLPGIGDFANFEFGKLISSFHSKYGKISRFGGIPGREDIIFIFDPNDIETVLRNDGAWPQRPVLRSMSYYRDVTRKEFFRDAGGLIASQGPVWGKFRTTVNQPLMQPRVAKNYVPPIDEVATDFIQRMLALRDGNNEMPKDFINELYKWALESISMIALDTRLGCLEPTLSPDSEPQRMIDTIKVVFDSMFDLDFKIPIWRVISTPTWRRFVASSDFMRETGMKYVNRALERLKSLPPDSDRELSVLERILARDPNPKVACVMAIEMMMAGIDTTSNAVSYLLYHLAVNPDKQKILQAEIDRMLPSSKTVITAEHLNEMKYLKACIKESMRIQPVAEANARATSKDMVLQGYQVPKGTSIIMCHHAMNLLEDHYPQADKFIPERWLKKDLEIANKTHPFVTMPFGFGVRMCVGRRFAEMEVQVLTTKILQRFNIEWHHGPLVVVSKNVNACKSPLRFKMIDRI